MELLVRLLVELLSHGEALTHWKKIYFILCTCMSSPFILCSVNADSPSLCLHPFFYQRLTSYVAKVFSMAYSLVDIDLNVICGAIKWVILNSQRPDGRFIEIGRVIFGEMMVCTWSYKTIVMADEHDFGCLLTLVYM